MKGFSLRRGIALAFVVMLLLAVAIKWPDSGAALSSQDSSRKLPATAAAPPKDSVLEPSRATLAGVIEDATGHAISQADIQIRQGDKLIANFASDAGGRFSGWAPAGAVQLQVEAQGYQPARVQSFVPALDIEITLYPGYPVQGIVLQERTLRPVPAVRVVASTISEGSEHGDAWALTDEQGRFTIANAPPGRVFLGVSDQRVWGRAKTLVIPEQRGEAVRILVVPAAQVAGRLSLSDTGQPCPDGNVTLIPQELLAANAKYSLQAVYNLEFDQDPPAKTPVPPLSAKANDAGEVMFPSVPYGEYRVAPTCAQLMVESGPGTVTVRSADISGPEWRFNKGTGIAIRVTDANGRGVPAASLAVTLLAAAPSAASSLEAANTKLLSGATRVAKTDREGSYRFAGLQEGVYDIVASSPGNSAIRAHAEATMRRGDDTPVTLALPLVGAIHIHAFDTAGQPISRLLFHANDQDNRRFEAHYVGGGGYEIGPLPRGSYQVYAYDNKNPKIAVEGQAGRQVLVDDAQPARLEFQYEAPQGVIEGAVVDANGNPAKAAVQAVSSTLTSEDEFHSTYQVEIHGEQYRLTNEQGRFRIENVQPGAAYRLFVQGTQGEKIEQKNVLAGQFVQIALPALSAISGTAVDGDGRALQDFAVITRSLDTEDQRSQEFRSASGRFSLTHVNPGNLEITVLSVEQRLHGSLVTQLLPGESRSGLRIVATGGAANENVQ